MFFSKSFLFCPSCHREWTACSRCFWRETTQNTSPCPPQQCRGVLTSEWGWPCPWTTNTYAATASLWVFCSLRVKAVRGTAFREGGWNSTIWRMNSSNKILFLCDLSCQLITPPPPFPWEFRGSVPCSSPLDLLCPVPCHLLHLLHFHQFFPFSF